MQTKKKRSTVYAWCLTECHTDFYSGKVNYHITFCARIVLQATSAWVFEGKESYAHFILNIYATYLSSFYHIPWDLSVLTRYCMAIGLDCVMLILRHMNTIIRYYLKCLPHTVWHISHVYCRSGVYCERLSWPNYNEKMGLDLLIRR